MTLAQKAQYVEDDLFAHHLQQGLHSDRPVDPEGKILYTNENAGSYTSVLLSSLVHKWHLTGDPAVRQKAHAVARAVLMLEWATGIPGYTTRQYKFMQGPGHDEGGWLEDKWHQCRFHRWQDNLSTDETTWYFQALGDYIRFCAEGEYRRAAAASLRRCIGRMLDHGMRIAYEDGTTTTWGDCSRATPREPLFCLHGLAYLKRGELFTGDPRFADAYDEYVRDELYFYEAVHCYRLGVERGHWAARYDWELAAPEFEILITFDRDPRRRQALTEGLLEMASAPDTTVHSPLCTAALGLGGEDQVRAYLQQFNPEATQSGIDKDWFLWAYWKARAVGVISADE